MVEFRRTETGELPYPVEYKRGKPKPNNPDVVQLCALALCLEEMLHRPVPEGALFYGQRKRRLEVPLDESLRHRTISTITAVHALLCATATLPEPATDERCRACSLLDVCMPRLWQGKEASRYLSQLIHSS